MVEKLVGQKIHRNCDNNIENFTQNEPVEIHIKPERGYYFTGNPLQVNQVMSYFRDCHKSKLILLTYFEYFC